MRSNDGRVLSLQEIEGLTHEQRKAYMRRLGRRAIRENREALDLLAAYDRGEPVAAGRERQPV